jgi:ABC-type glycerol-3-phosphate transport system substrate-binding protein
MRDAADERGVGQPVRFGASVPAAPVLHSPSFGSADLEVCAMRHRLIWLAALASTLLLAAIAASTSSAADSGQLTVVGPWQGRDAASFQAVLSAFMQKNPSITVTYKPVAGDVAAAVPTSAADLAVLSLPADQSAMAAMERSGVLKSIDFAAPAVAANYAYSWKLLGSVDGKLTGLFFKATNRSAFWYDTQAFKNLGATAPSSLSGLGQLVRSLKGHGAAPFAISGGSAVALPNLFQNLYLAFEGNHLYDQLASGKLSWSSPSVARVLAKFKSMFGSSFAGGTASLAAPYSAAVQAVFGSPMRAYMVPGGSAALRVLYSAKAVRPLARFSAFAFPQVDAHAPARVIGDANAVVMVKNSDAGRALVSYLATPEAATIWAKQGGFYLSPNRNVSASAYAVPQMAELAQALAGANTFRFAISDTHSSAFKATMNLQLQRYLEGLDTRGDVMSRLAIAAGEK